MKTVKFGMANEYLVTLIYSSNIVKAREPRNNLMATKAWVCLYALLVLIICILCI